MQPSFFMVHRTAFHRLIILMMSAGLCLSLQGSDDLYSPEAWIKEGLAEQVGKFRQLTLVPHPDQNGIVAANCESDPSWWGRLRVFHHTGDTIDWIATLPASYQDELGHYIISCRWISPGPDLTLLEVISSTHMGNGTIHIFNLEDHNLRPVLCATAVGRCWKPPQNIVVPFEGEARYRSQDRQISHTPPDNDSPASVHIKGTIVITDSQGMEVSTAPYEEIWTWDLASRVFQKRP